MFLHLEQLQLVHEQSNSFCTFLVLDIGEFTSLHFESVFLEMFILFLF